MTREDRLREDQRTADAVAVVQAKLDAALAEVEGLKRTLDEANLEHSTCIEERDAALDLLRECPGFMEHDDARCEYFGKCQCGLDDLRARIRSLVVGEAGK